jgi:dTDP-glucose pyrophosphorylase
MSTNKKLTDYIISEDKTIIEAMNVINANARGVAFVCDEGILKGVVTDGNIRRYIISGGDIGAAVSSTTNYTPKYINHHENIDAEAFMKKNAITSVPIVNRSNEVLAIRFLNEDRIYKSANLNIPVVIMAGGKGTRLLPFTEVLPKPLIPVGDKTIIETIMDRFVTFGCNTFDVIVNYKQDLIKAYFTDSEYKYDVRFVSEEKYCGTGGGLSLLKGTADKTFFMSNCDILIDEDYGEIFRHHKERENIVTMVAAMKNIAVEYGTISVADDGSVVSLNEKPTYSMLVNTGLYVIEPEFLDYIPEDTFIHITDAIEACIKAGERVGAYPISETAWLDMGNLLDLKKIKEYIE